MTFHHTNVCILLKHSLVRHFKVFTGLNMIGNSAPDMLAMRLCPHFREAATAETQGHGWGRQTCARASAPPGLAFPAPSLPHESALPLSQGSRFTPGCAQGSLCPYLNRFFFASFRGVTRSGVPCLGGPP